MTVMCYSPPCITAAKRKRGSAQPQKKRGRLRHQENAAKPPQPTQTAWFSDRRCGFVLDRKTTPASRSVDASRCVLIARPPLLAMVQGGEYARFQFVHSFCERRRYR